MPLVRPSDGQQAVAASVDQFYDLHKGGRDYDVKNVYGAVADGQQVSDGVTTAGSAVLTSATANFQPSDVGKVLVVDHYYNDQVGSFTKGPASNNHTLATTISGYTNSTTVTMATAATNSASGCLVGWGTDNRTQIQQAIDDCHNAGGGVVYIPPGRYQMSPIASQVSDNKFVSYWAGGILALLIIRSRVRLQGAGMGATTLQGVGYYPSPGFFKGMLTTEIPADGHGFGNVGTELSHHFIVDGITWDSQLQWWGAPVDFENNFQRELDQGVFACWNNANWRISNCEFLNTGTKPIYIFNGDTSVPNYADRFEIVDNYFHASAGNFYSLNYASNFIISRNLHMDGSADGAESVIGRYIKDGIVEGNVFYHTGNIGGWSAPDGVPANRCSDVRIVNNYVRAQPTTGFSAAISVNQCDRTVISGNVIDQSEAPGGVGLGISIGGAMADLVIANNTVQCGRTPGSAYVGIAVNGGFGANTRVAVIGNTVSGGGLNVLASTNCVIAHNTVDGGLLFNDSGYGRVEGNVFRGTLQPSSITGSPTHETAVQNNYFSNSSSPTPAGALQIVGGGSVLLSGNTIDRGSASNTIFENPAPTSPCFFLNNRILGGGIIYTGAVARSAVFRGNIGLNPVGTLVATPSVPASGISLQNATHYDCFVFVTGGTVSSIVLGAVAPPSAPPASDGGSGGSGLPTGTYTLVQTWVTAQGETTASASTTYTQTVANDQIAIAAITAPNEATSAKFYVTGGTAGVTNGVASTQTVSAGKIAAFNITAAPGGAAAPPATNGTGFATGLTNGSFRLPALSSMVLVYTVAPTWRWVGD